MSGDRASKETKLIVILIIISMVIWFAVFGLNKNNNEKAVKEQEHLELIRDVSIPDKVIFEDTGSVITLVREGTEWKCEEGGFYINTTVTTYLFSVLKHFDPEEDRQVLDSDLAGTGLMPPERKIIFSYQSGEKRVFYIGKYNPFVGLFYFMPEGDDHFYMIAPEQAVFFLLGEEQLRKA